MKFELLPNEILIECFEYLNVYDLFNSFDQLNFRFTQLIRSLHLHLNFRHIIKPKFDQICRILELPLEIKNQIFGIHLSNEGAFDQIDTFISRFSFNEFPNLQTLSFITPNPQNIVKLAALFPLSIQLSSFRLINAGNEAQKLLSVVPMSNLQRMFLFGNSYDSRCLSVPSTLTHLTLSYFYFDNSWKLFKNAPLLKYLNLQTVTECSSYRYYRQSFQSNQNIHLKKLILRNFQCSFKICELFMLQTPNLEHLTVTGRNNFELINAHQWEQVITSSLSQLKQFQFEFSYRHRTDVLNQFQQFQSGFWLKHNHWYTDYSCTDKFAVIHTIPYLGDTFLLEKPPIIYHLNKADKFVHVKTLYLYSNIMINSHQYYFPNVTSLTLQHDFESDSLIETMLLPTIVNLSNLQHLNIIDHSSKHVQMILLDVMKHAPNLSSLSICLRDLQVLMENDDLWKYLNKKIKRLDNYYQLKTQDEVELFCKLFSNIEHFNYTMYKHEHLLYLLNNLSSLSILNIHLSIRTRSENFLNWFEGIKSKLNMTVHIKANSKDTVDLFPTQNFFCLWIERNSRDLSLICS